MFWHGQYNLQYNIIKSYYFNVFCFSKPFVRRKSVSISYRPFPRHVITKHLGLALVKELISSSPFMITQFCTQVLQRYQCTIYKLYKFIKMFMVFFFYIFLYSITKKLIDCIFYNLITFSCILLISCNRQIIIFI